MKLTAKILTGMLAASLVFAMAGCKNGDDEQKSEPTAVITETDGTTTLNLQENKTGFVSTEGKVSSDFLGYTGSGYIDNLGDGATIVYTISAKATITDAKIAMVYANWEASRARAAHVYVNGTCINPDTPIPMPYTFKGNKTDDSKETVAKRWQTSSWLTGVTLNEGSNVVMLTGAPAGTYSYSDGSTYTVPANHSGMMNNIDYLIVNGKDIDYGTDTTPWYAYAFSSENETGGSVASTLAAGSHKQGSSVTVTATAKDGWTFECWSDGSTANPYTFTIEAATDIQAHFIPTGATVPAGLKGYATITNNNGAAYTITGGAGGSTINITSYADTVTYAEQLAGNDPYIVKVSGTITYDTSKKCNLGSNKTVYGDPENQGRFKNVQLNVSGDNVIIRNMMFGEVIAYDGQSYSGDANDALGLSGCQHVWIDHCELQSHLTPQLNDGSTPPAVDDEKFAKDFYDGLLDMKNGCSWVTVSNCYFHDHWKAFLCESNSDEKSAALGKTMRLTLYGNLFENIYSRQPKFRWGKAHIFGNAYVETASETKGASNCIDVNAGAEILAEGNYFEGLKNVIGNFTEDSMGESWRYTNTNVTKSCTNTPSVGTSTFSPAYTYDAVSKGALIYAKMKNGEATGAENPTAGVGILTASDLQ
jgi:pectate lyase